MKSILQLLYNGEIFPSELIIPKGPEYRQINKKIEEEKQKLSEEDCKRFEELDDLCCQSYSMRAKESFLYGFKLGALIIAEVFTGQSQLYRNVGE